MACPGDDDDLQLAWSDYDSSDLEEDFQELERKEAVLSSEEADSRSDDHWEASSGKNVCGKCADEAPQAVTASTSDGQGRPSHMASTGPGCASKPHPKLKVKRPASHFREADAMKEGPGLVKDALVAATKYPPFLLKIGSMVTPGNTAANTAEAMLKIWGTVDSSRFITTLCTSLWSVISAREKSVLNSACNEAMYSAYHKYCTSEMHHTLCNTFMSSIGVNPCVLLYQFVTKRVQEGILHLKYSADISNDTDTSVNMTYAERQILRYIAGYIPHAMLRRYQKYSNNMVAKLYVSFLKQCSVPPTNSSYTTFLQYAQGWINTVDDGRLFTVTDEVYLFFRAVENVVRYTANLCKGRLTSIKDAIVRNLEVDVEVNKYWCCLASNSITNEKASIALLESFLSYYVDIRCTAFADLSLTSLLKPN
ncbi:uncharacterized protein LOC118405089 [Branchiostoma floridae]|uniref:Uncharacterized protein LOC118405089 n=1 Tax=Branchiostoma floridae TaxID=7739 RepID=A0A9J7KHL1_BRAFL|nr:uncharacterized protein LOC118405089 [Branchiostoma floridae]